MIPQGFGPAQSSRNETPIGCNERISSRGLFSLWKRSGGRVRTEGGSSICLR